MTLRHDAYQRLTAGNVAPEKLIEKSFEFLLERESNTSILCRVDLPVIGVIFRNTRKPSLSACRGANADLAAQRQGPVFFGPSWRANFELQKSPRGAEATWKKLPRVRSI